MLTFDLKRRSEPIVSPVAKSALLACSIITAFLIGGVLIEILGASPILGYRALLAGAFGSIGGFIDVIVKATPLLLTGLGTAVAFGSGQFNIGSEGQIYMGALVAAWVDLTFQGLPKPILLGLAILGGATGGAAWALIPAALKAFRGVNELIPSLMSNYVAILIIRYLVNGPMQQPDSYMPQTALVPARLPLLSPAPYRLHAGFVLALCMTAAVYILMRRTSLGFGFRAVGASPAAAKYGGVRIRQTVLLVMIISGGLSGLAGANELLGFHYRLIEGFSAGYGFTGILVALLGRLNPVGVAAASFLFSSLSVGANNMQRILKIPSSIAGIIQSIVVLLVLGTQVLLEYRPSVSFSPTRRTVD